MAHRNNLELGFPKMTKEKKTLHTTPLSEWSRSPQHMNLHFSVSDIEYIRNMPPFRLSLQRASTALQALFRCQADRCLDEMRASMPDAHDRSDDTTA